MITCLIVDDEFPAREEIKYILSKTDKVKIVGEASHGLDAIEKYQNLNPDLIIMDIQMPQINGIEVARRILDHNPIPMIIFVTAYDQFAVDAFEVNAVDYLLKPISEERLLSRIDKIHSSRSKKEEIQSIEKLNRLINELRQTTPCSRISVYHNNKLIPINTKDIIYITVENKATIIAATSGKYESRNSLNEILKKLEPSEFFRTHKSYILNLNFIESIDPWFNSTYNINLKGSKTVIPVSRNYVKEFKIIMNI